MRLAIDHALLFQVSRKLAGRGGLDVHDVETWRACYINMVDIYNRRQEWIESGDPRSRRYDDRWASEGLTLFRRFEKKLKMYTYGDMSVKQIDEEFRSGSL